MPEPAKMRFSDASEWENGPSPECGRCGNAIAPAERSTKFCDACIDRCHEATEFDHVCQICATPGEARHYGWKIYGEPA
jgi:predicted amidophosphoribosyltransferase